MEGLFTKRAKPCLVLLPLILLVACGGGEGDGEDTSSSNIDLSTLTKHVLPITGVDLALMRAAFGLSFISSIAEFNQTRLAAVRSEAAFRSNVLSVGSGRVVRPYSASRLDWVRSIDKNNDNQPDLTGAGVVLGMIDSAVRMSHEQFSNDPTKFVLGAGNTNPSNDSHGTAVASVIAGTGGTFCPPSSSNCTTTIGYAPGAKLHAGTISYRTSLNYLSLGALTNSAAAAGAVAINNSWSLDSSIVVNTNVADLGADFGVYLSALRQYTQNGVVVFAQLNEPSPSASFLAGLPAQVPELEQGWLSVINVYAGYDEATDKVVFIRRASSGCLETARWCLGATGYVRTADIDNDFDYQISNGTSFAAPQVTGALGLLAQAFPTATPAQLRNRLLATADNSFFTPTAVLEFVPGVVHGYNEEFGHGFLNVRNALMPIGTTTTATAAGETVQIKEIELSGGTIGGDALARGLANVSLGYQDQMFGTFAAPMSAFLAPSVVQVGSEAALSNWASNSSGALFAHKGLSDDFRSTQSVELEPGLSVAGLLASDGKAGGVSAALHASSAKSAVTLELSAVASDDDLFQTDFGGPGGGSAVSVKLSMTQDINPLTEVSLSGEVGLLEASHGGIVSGVDAIRFSSASISVTRSSVLSHGDSLKLFAQSPIGIVSGNAHLDVQRPSAAGSAASAASAFQSVSVSLAPVDREINLGFEYQMPSQGVGEVLIGLMQVENAGHVAGVNDQVAMLGWRTQF